jgi:hypothetical protein
MIAHDVGLLLREVSLGEEAGEPITAVDTPVRAAALRARLIRVASKQPDPSRWVITDLGRQALTDWDR